MKAPRHASGKVARASKASRRGGAGSPATAPAPRLKNLPVSETILEAAGPVGAATLDQVTKDPERRASFMGQRIVMLPRRVIVSLMQKRSLLRGLVVAGAGYYPGAAGHLRRRPKGSEQTILIYCVRGAGWGELAGAIHAVKAGDLLVLPPGVPHSYGADKARPWTIYWFHAMGTLWQDFLHELGVTPEHPVVSVGEDVGLTALFEEIIEVIERDHKPLDLIEASLALGHLLGRMVRRRHEHWGGAMDATRKVARSIAFVQEHLDQSLTVSALAAVANISPSHFMVLFKQQTGYPPHEYVKGLRMHRARQQLDNSFLSIKEIAATIGFKDSAHFSRTFKAVYQIAPRDYRLRRH